MSERDEHATMIADCVARESKLSDWERSFIDSLGNYLSSGGALSEKQVAQLDKIWNAIT